MPLYAGNQKLKITFENKTCLLNIPPIKDIVTEIKLLSFDNYILQDVNGLYLIPKESE